VNADFGEAFLHAAAITEATSPPLFFGGFRMFFKSVEYIKSRIGDFVPELLITLGTGLGELVRICEIVEVIPYTEIPGFVKTTTDHKGNLIFGHIGGKSVVLMQGRVHIYEGYTPEQVVYPLRVCSMLGVKGAILTNACGAIDPSLKISRPAIISDHIRLFGFSPAAGPDTSMFGPRFFDMTKAYTPEWRQIAARVGREHGEELREVVYFYFPGPQFETPAEIRAARALGADVIGMSTVYETVAAVQRGMKVLGISLITNAAAGVSTAPITAEEVNDAAEDAEAFMCSFLEDVIRELVI